MSDETQGTPAAEAAPETVVTATPPSEATPPEATPEAPPPKTFTQEELDAIIGKRLAKEQRKWEREQARAAQVAQPQPAGEPPKAEQFETPEAYALALAEQLAAEKLGKMELDRQQAEVNEAFAQRVEEALEKYDDFTEVVQNPNLPITQEMAQVIRASEIGPELAYHLGTNPTEAARISRLSPFLQAKEIGRLEAKLVANPPTKKTSTAPAPIAPVTARGATNESKRYETTDPRSIFSMSPSEWIVAERERQIRKMRGQ